ncbi:MAG: [protein-PII] uridylyltransferase [Alphaproteobacteria bacterium]
MRTAASEAELAPTSLLPTFAARARGIDATAPQTRARILDEVKQALAAGRRQIQSAFLAGAPVHDTMAANADLIDQLLRDLLDFALRYVFPAPNPTTGDRICVAAVGGYGRGELAPWSDIDLLFLLPYKKTPRSEQVVEYVLYMLWDTGLKVGHSTRTVDECLRLARDDSTIATSLLESRWIWGETELYEELRRRFRTELVQGTGPAFLEAKLAERDQRHRRLGDSRYVLEPNVKDGKGGLRDLHTLYWIAKYLYQVEDATDLVGRGVLTRAELRRFEKAEEFLSTVRCHLHYLADRPEDRLTFDMQIEIGARMGYTDRAGTRGVERFMKHYYLTAKDVGDLTRIFCATLEAEHRRRPRFDLSRILPRGRSIGAFRVEAGRLTVRDAEAFSSDPVNLLRLFHIAQARDFDVHPHALRLVTRNLRLVDAVLRADAEANRLFVEMLTSRHDPETTLRRLSEAGVLARFIPAFGRVVAQMQYDMYHTYTVDEHTIRAIGILDRIETGELADTAPVATEAVAKIVSRRALYLAAFLHDIAKGRGGDHSILGAKVAEEMCPRLGLTPEETETVAWLVRYHLLMSNTAFKRDLNDPQTIRDFVATVRSPERLRLLLVLTVADIRAVGPDVWNNWKATLLRSLYFRAEEELSGGVDATPRKGRLDKALAALRTELPDWDDERFARHTAEAPAYYWLSADTATLTRQARLVDQARQSDPPFVVEARVAADRDATELSVCTPDHPGLFSRIAGAIALTGGNIVAARIFTLGSGLALDTFWIQSDDGHAYDRPERLARLEGRIRDALAGRIDLRKELRKQPAWPTRTSVFTVQPRVLIDNRASGTHTLIEVNGRDRPGFLYDVARALSGAGAQIASARISTFGETAIDVFYVKDVFGLKIEHEGKLRQLREALLQAMADPTPSKEKQGPIKPTRHRSSTKRRVRAAPPVAAGRRKARP